MKKTLALVCALAVLVASLASVLMFAGAASGGTTYSEATLPVFRDLEGNPVDITPTTDLTELDCTDAVEAVTNTSPLPFTTLYSASAAGPLLAFDEFATKDYKGVMLYVEIPDVGPVVDEANGTGSTDVFKFSFSLLKGSENHYPAQFAGKMYTMALGDTEWSEKSVNYFGIDIEYGFKGYVYAPFDNTLFPTGRDFNENTKVSMFAMRQITDNKDDVYRGNDPSPYLYQGLVSEENPLIFSEPVFIKKADATDTELPTTEALIIEEETVYLAPTVELSEATLPVFRDLEGNPVDITPTTDLETLDCTDAVGVVANTSPLPFTTLYSAPAAGPLLAFDEFATKDYKGVLLYVEIPDVGPVVDEANGTGSTDVFKFSFTLMEGSTSHHPAQSAGKMYTLALGDDTWSEKSVSYFGIDIEYGFKGYVYAPFDNTLFPTGRDFNENTKVSMFAMRQITDNKDDVYRPLNSSSYLYQGLVSEENPLIFSEPVFIKKADAADTELPTTDALIIEEEVAYLNPALLPTGATLPVFRDLEGNPIKITPTTDLEGLDCTDAVGVVANTSPLSLSTLYSAPAAGPLLAFDEFATKDYKGVLLYVEIPDVGPVVDEANGTGSTDVFKFSFTLMEGSTSHHPAQSAGKMYTLALGDNTWSEKSVSYFGIDIEYGFKGYVYAPFDNTLFPNERGFNENTKVSMFAMRQITDNKDDVYRPLNSSSYLYQGLVSEENPLIFSEPVFIKKAAADDTALPTTNIVIDGVDDEEDESSSDGSSSDGSSSDGSSSDGSSSDGSSSDGSSSDGSSSDGSSSDGSSSDGSSASGPSYDLPFYTGTKPDYSKYNSIATAWVARFNDDDANVVPGQPLSEAAQDIADANYTVINSITKISNYPCVELTATSGMKDIFYTALLDQDIATGAMSVMYYVEVPAGKTAAVSFRCNFMRGTTKLVTNNWSRDLYILAEGSNTWEAVPTTSYFATLPAGFKGYVRQDYADLATSQDVRPNKDDKLAELWMLVKGLSRNGTIKMSAPILLDEMTEDHVPTAVIMKGDTAARNLFTGEYLIPGTGNSDTELAPPTPEKVPTATTDLKVEVSDKSGIADGKATVSWQAFTGASKYVVKVYKNKQGSNGVELDLAGTFNATGTSVEITGLELGTRYTIVVTALNAKGSDIAVYESISLLAEVEEEPEADAPSTDSNTDTNNDPAADAEPEDTGLSVWYWIAIIAVAVLVLGGGAVVVIVLVKKRKN